MRNKTSLAMVLVTLLSTVAICWSQTEKVAASDEVKYYRLDFVVKELEGGKVVNTRSYAMTISTEKGGSGSSIRSGGKVPVPSNPQQFTYIEVGVNIDCRAAKEIADRLALNVAADISAAGTPGNASTPPLIRNTKWSSNVVVPVHKPTVIFSSDDASSKLQTQLELTATLIK